MTHKRTTDGINDTISTYECKEAKKGCPHVVIIKTSHKTGHSIITEREAGHDHSNSNYKVTELSKEAKKFMLENLELTAGQLQMRMKSQGMPIISSVQINNFLNRQKKKKGVQNQLTEHELKEMASQHPRNDDIPNKCYVDYQNLGVRTPDGKIDFGLMFTTPSLMQKQISQPSIQSDVTFKLTWKGYPLMVTGFSDINRKFHPTSLTLISEENTVTYKYVFSKIRSFDPESPYSPLCAMGDGSASLTKALRDIFGEDVYRHMCFFHLMERVKPKVKHLSKEVQDKIFADIRILKCAIHPDEFLVASELMLQDWSDNGIDEDFINYFRKQWVDGDLCNWYSGCSEYGNTNNGVEKKNCSIKDSVTLRKRLTVRDLFQKLITAVELYAESPDYSVEPLKISLDDYRLAYEYKQIQPQVKCYGKNQKEFFIQSSKLSDQFESYVASRRELSFDNWHHYTEISQNCYFVRMSSVFKSVLFCSCPVGAKKQVCKHSLALACKLKLASFPEAVSSLVLDGKRKPGRPPKALRGQALSRN